MKALISFANWNATTIYANHGHAYPLQKELRVLVLYSPAHIDRLEKAGLFPKRVRLGSCRVGWVESEVLDWLQRRIDLRDEDQHTLNITSPGEINTRPAAK